MEKKIGKNVSSGAEKVESTEKELRQARAAAPAKKSGKKQAVKSETQKKSATKAQAETGKPAEQQKEKAVKKTPAKKKRTEALKKREKKAAQKRVEAAKAKAEKKEKAVARRAELKAKRLERKKMIAQKRAERKEKRIEKRAAYKEKKLEKHAERVARRETLKNESRGEKHKRLEREKRERIALKRQKAEAREKAREQKIKAREAAHARKAADKKNKREHRTERKKHAPGFGGWLAAVISLGVACLALATVVTAGAFRMNEMTLSSENTARATLYEMMSISEDMDNSLSKLRIATGAEEQRRLLQDVLVESALMETAIERIPVDAATGTDISAFVNKTNAYVRTLLKKLASGATMSETERNTVTYLYEVNATLNDELNQLAMNMTEKDFRAFLSGKGGALSEGFGEMGQTSKRTPETTVDAPFSGEGNVGENQLSGLEEISSARAEELVRGYFEAYHVRDVRYTGETQAQNMNCYNFVMTDENDIEIYAQVTKNGGKLVFFDTYEVCTQKNFDLNTCDTLAREFLSSIGIDNAEAVWLSDGGMVADITYVSCDNGVCAYPDMIRVRVCESKGRVVGVDAKGYFMNHTERDLSAGLSEEEARTYLPDSYEVNAGKLVLIPIDNEETLAYEYFVKQGEEEYLVYLDADSGEEVQVLIVRNGVSGSYLK